MSNKMIPFFLLCETPLHVGVGSDVGIVDMPIQRERHTGWPKIEASGLKGSIRASFEKNSKDLEELIDVNVVFGYDDNGLDKRVKEKFEGRKDFSGALGFSDGRILLFPVKSMKGIFAWITSPAVLDRFFKDLSLADINLPNFSYKEFTVGPQSACVIDKKGQEGKIVLEEYTELVVKDKEVEELGKWLGKHILPNDDVYTPLRKKLEKDLVILSDDLFSEFVSLATEVTTRTKIDNETGTVKGTALFTEEYLPAESLMYSFAIASSIFGQEKGSFGKEGRAEEVGKFFTKGLSPLLQIGGNSNLGKGLVSTKIFGVIEDGQ